MKLIIMRHGQAEWSALSDAERPLTDQGRAQVKRTAGIIKSRYQVKKVLASPYLRAQQTAELVAGELGCRVETVDDLVPEGNAQAVINNLSETETVLLASHMPLVSELTGLVCEGVVNSGPCFHTGAAVVVDCELIAIGTGQLVETIFP